MTLSELRTSKETLLRLSHLHTFKDEIHSLKRKKELPNNHTLAGLAPFVDSQNMLRVGGRLQQAGLSYDNTHPLNLSSKSHIVYLLVQFTHVLAAFHPHGNTGTQLSHHWTQETSFEDQQGMCQVPESLC